MAYSDVTPIRHSLQIDEDLQLHKKGWLTQRIGWAVFFLVLVFTALGLFGKGILSSREVQNGPNRIEYQHFGRFETETDMKIQAIPMGGLIRVAFHQGYLEEFRIEKVFPQPYDYQFKDGSHVYFFPAEEPLDILVTLTPQMAGSMHTLVNVNGANFDVNHFIYP